MTPTFSSRNLWLRTTCGVLTAAAGSAGLAFMLAVMNGESSGGEEKVETRKVSFNLPEPKDEPKKKPKPKKRERKQGPAKKAAARVPQVASGLSGPSFGLPGLDPADGSDLSADVLGATDNVVMTEDTVDVLPRAVDRPGSLPYPARARRDGVTGYVLLNLLIGPDGRVQKTKVLDAQPAGVFEEAAVPFVQQWTFSPALYQGQPVKTWVRQRIQFELN